MPLHALARAVHDDSFHGAADSSAGAADIADVFLDESE